MNANAGVDKSLDGLREAEAEIDAALRGKEGT